MDIFSLPYKFQLNFCKKVHYLSCKICHFDIKYTCKFFNDVNLPNFIGNLWIQSNRLSIETYKINALDLHNCITQQVLKISWIFYRYHIDIFHLFTKRYQLLKGLKHQERTKGSEKYSSSFPIKLIT